MVMMIVIACYRQGRGWEGQDELCQLCQAKKMADLLRGHTLQTIIYIDSNLQGSLVDVVLSFRP